MLRTNLSTRPFYNERAVHWGLALAAALLVALTIFNVQKVLTLTREQARLSEASERDEGRARTLSTQAARVRGTIDQASLERVINAAREANAVIDERTFSWTELFNHIESTLPANVMLTAVQPRVESSAGDVTVLLTVIGREVENVDEFIENLEKTGVFSNVLATSEQVTEEGTFEVTLSGNYRPAPLKLAPAKSEEGKPAEARPDDAKPAQGKPAEAKPEQKKPNQEGA